MKIKFFDLTTLAFAIALAGCGEQPYSIIQDASDLLGQDGTTIQIPGIPIGTNPGETPGGTPISFGNTNCTIGYPVASANPATSVVFNESEILAAFGVQGLTISVWYDDEHAMALGVRQVVVKAANGTSTTTNYPVSALSSNPGSMSAPQVGVTAMTGDQSGTDASACAGGGACARPVAPSLFVTDTTTNPNNQSGDWQYGGTPVPPHGIYGTWKGTVRTVDYTKTPAAVTVATDADPAKNNWNLGTGIAAPTGIVSAGFGTMASWDVGALGLQSGHLYRLQFMVHDGDQNKSGGDAGENCVNILIP